MNKESSHVVEGFQGRMSLWMSGIFFIIGGIVLYQLRALIHGTNQELDLENVFTWIAGALFLIILVIPFVHQAIHALATLGLGSGLKIFFGRIYPRVRPAKPVSVTGARLFLLAPQALTLVCVIGILIKSIAVASAFVGAVNIAVSANDIWKILGLKRVDPTARLQFHRDYCEVITNEG